MDCIIIDDELTARNIIQKLCVDYKNLNIVKGFSNGIDAIKYLTKNQIDVVFLDIHMPNFDGFDFIESLKNPPKVILITSDSNFAIKAFKYDCVIDYLLKPILSSRFQLAIQKLEKIVSSSSGLNSAKTNTEDTETDLFINVFGRLTKIKISSINLIKSDGDYAVINSDENTYRVHSTLIKILNKLPENLFIRVHRSYIINIKKIVDIEDNTLLINKIVIPIGRTYRALLMKRLNLL